MVEPFSCKVFCGLYKNDGGSFLVSMTADKFVPERRRQSLLLALLPTFIVFMRFANMSLLHGWNKDKVIRTTIPPQRFHLGSEGPCRKRRSRGMGGLTNRRPTFGEGGSVNDNPG